MEFPPTNYLELDIPTLARQHGWKEDMALTDWCLLQLVYIVASNVPLWGERKVWGFVKSLPGHLNRGGGMPEMAQKKVPPIQIIWAIAVRTPKEFAQILLEQVGLAGLTCRDIDLSDELLRRYGAQAHGLRWDGETPLFDWFMAEFGFILDEELMHLSPERRKELCEPLFTEFWQSQTRLEGMDEVDLVWLAIGSIFSADGKIDFREWLRAKTELFT